MSVMVYLPAFLQPYANGRSRIVLEGGVATVDDALQALWRAAPGVRDRVVDELGHVRQHVNVFVEDESIRFTGGLTTTVPDRCAISIVPAVSGG